MSWQIRPASWMSRTWAAGPRPRLPAVITALLVLAYLMTLSGATR